MFNSLLHYFVNFVVVIVEGTESVFSSTRYIIDTSGTLEIFKREREKRRERSWSLLKKDRPTSSLSIDSWRTWNNGTRCFRSIVLHCDNPCRILRSSLFRPAIAHSVNTVLLIPVNALPALNSRYAH